MWFSFFCPHMNIVFWEPCDFYISFAIRDMSWMLQNCHWGRSIVKTGVFSSIWSFPLPLSPMLNDIQSMTMYSDTLHPLYMHQFITFYQTAFHWTTTGFHETFAMDMACRQWTLTPPRTWSRPILSLDMLFFLIQIFRLLSHTFCDFPNFAICTSSILRFWNIWKEINSYWYNTFILVILVSLCYFHSLREMEI